MKHRLFVTADNGVVHRHSPRTAPPVAPHKEAANFFTGMTGNIGAPVNTTVSGGPTFTTMFNGILPEYNEQMLTALYRDCYYYDAIAGAAIDIMSSLPFSEFTLTGLDSKDLTPFVETCDRINLRGLAQEVSYGYLTDGVFIGSLIYDDRNKVFQDVLVHDPMNASISPQPLFSQDPVITVNSANQLNQFLNSNSPYVASALASYPKSMLDVFSRGSAVLDPLATLYLPRRGSRDRPYISYLKRILPAYMLEKVLYRGTLVEATRRQRATSHIMVGDGDWEPTNAEMANVLSQFQQTELDPMGAWIVTRNGVQVNDVRPAGDFWKWTDTMESLTPYKLRALGISEAFLSGDASYASAEAAISVFLDNVDAYRQFLTWKLLTNKIFALVAISNNMYRDSSKARPPTSHANILHNLNNQKNLKVPGIRWHKSLNGSNTQSQIEMLDTLSEKGFTIPMKMWAAAADVDITMLIRDLEEDAKIRESIEAITGKSAAPDEGGDLSGGGFEASVQKGRPSLPAGERAFSRRLPLLSRDMTPVVGKTSKSGSHIEAMVGDHRQEKKVNDLIVKASRALQDPNHRASVRKKIAEKLGAAVNMNLA